MQVIIHGPNLRDQRKGTFHVHTADCQDNRSYGPGRKFGGEDNGMTVEAETALEVCAFIYADHLSDYGLTEEDAAGREMLEGWISDFHFAPCLNGMLEERKPAPAPQPARAKRPPLKKASWRAGIEWIALNDEPEDRDVDSVAGYISTLLLAELFGQEPELVAADVVRYRERNDV